MTRRFRPTDAFVDESIRGRRYLMACVLIEARQLTAVRQTVERLGVSGSRVHFNNESRRQKVKVLDAIATMPVEAIAVICHRRHGVSEYNARDICLGAIVGQLQARAVSRLVIESRQDDRDDERTIYASRQPQPRLVFEHRFGAHEPMLWVADAIAWAVGAGGPWSPRIKEVLSDAVELRP